MKDPDSNIEKVIDLGFVGEPKTVNRAVIDMVLGAELIPVIAPVAPGADGHTYNVNADTFAGAIAGALGAARLLFLTDVPGVLDKHGKLIKELTRRARPRALIADGTISGGMIPKVETCIEALERGRRGRRHPQRQDAARGAARALHRPRRRHADPAMTAAPRSRRSAPRSATATSPLRRRSTPGSSTSTTRSIPRHTNLYPQVDRRIRDFVRQLLNARRRKRRSGCRRTTTGATARRCAG